MSDYDYYDYEKEEKRREPVKRKVKKEYVRPVDMQLWRKVGKFLVKDAIVSMDKARQICANYPIYSATPVS